RHAGAGRRRGRLRPHDRLRCPPDRGIRVPPLGGVAGSPGMGRAEGGHEHPLSRGPGRLDGRQAGPGPGLTPQGSPTIPRVDPRRRHQRELVVLAVTILGLSRLLDGPLLGLGGAEQGQPITESGIVTIALADALVAWLLGYRFAAIRLSGARDALWAAGTYAAAIAVAAGLLRVVAIPRLASPALLTLVFYLWDTVRGSAPSLRRDPRFLWQSVLLAILAVAVVAWNLGLRGS